MKKTAFLLKMFPLNLIKSSDLIFSFQEYEGERNKLNGNKKKTDKSHRRIILKHN